MELEPKAAAVAATALRCFTALAPLMGTQALSEAQSERLQALCEQAHNALTAVARPAVEFIADCSDEELLAMDPGEFMEWGWLVDVLNHVEEHANDGRARYEVIVRARIARNN